MQLTREIIDRYNSILDRGLCAGVGNRDGQMCIEAAVCAALDLPHGDDPQCVSAAVRSFKIALNDAAWSSPQARAAGLRQLGIAQIGSKGVVDDVEFAKRLVEKMIRVLIPKLFRNVLKNYPGCMVAADRCEAEGTQGAAAGAAEAAWAAEAALAAWAAWAAEARAAAEAAKWAARAAKWAARAADAAAEADQYLILSAQLALETLQELKSPGCEWL